ncbi:MAG: hypothetical protein SP1CHLAM54_15660 [Chlamydiia bacterium]|nr:hypothetical protein [Chlamydiia bacterium]MCH9616456.1 hypothetical protein [Chlamydiia bacterium]MCH9629558.1 hypothetical protein [Chlamydiia bacterium]
MLPTGITGSLATNIHLRGQNQKALLAVALVAVGILAFSFAARSGSATLYTVGALDSAALLTTAIYFRSKQKSKAKVLPTSPASSTTATSSSGGASPAPHKLHNVGRNRSSMQRIHQALETTAGNTCNAKGLSTTELYALLIVLAERDGPLPHIAYPENPTIEPSVNEQAATLRDYYQAHKTEIQALRHERIVHASTYELPQGASTVEKMAFLLAHNQLKNHNPGCYEPRTLHLVAGRRVLKPTQTAQRLASPQHNPATLTSAAPSRALKYRTPPTSLVLAPSNHQRRSTAFENYPLHSTPIALPLGSTHAVSTPSSTPSPESSTHTEFQNVLPAPSPIAADPLDNAEAAGRIRTELILAVSDPDEPAVIPNTLSTEEQRALYVALLDNGFSPYRIELKSELDTTHPSLAETKKIRGLLNRYERRLAEEDTRFAHSRAGLMIAKEFGALEEMGAFIDLNDFKDPSKVTARASRVNLSKPINYEALMEGLTQAERFALVLKLIVENGGTTPHFIRQDPVKHRKMEQLTQKMADDYNKYSAAIHDRARALKASPKRVPLKISPIEAFAYVLSVTG